MRASVVVSTYNQPRALELSLAGLAAQSRRDFEIVVADDGSTAETRAVVERVRAAAPVPVVHVWHPDDGFRKTEILNRAVVAASGDYLIFTDGDCIPRADWVATHLRHARPGAFLSGGYLKLPADVSARIAPDDVRAGRATDLAWLRAQGWRPGRHALRLLPDGALPALLDRATTTGATWNGHNASTWKAAIVAANGFDLDMTYGGEDRALGERLVNAGLHGVQIRHRAPVVHLDHPRPYMSAEGIRRNREMRARIRRDRETRARLGIAELDAGVGAPADAGRGR